MKARKGAMPVPSPAMTTGAACEGGRCISELSTETATASPGASAARYAEHWPEQRLPPGVVHATSTTSRCTESPTARCEEAIE